MRRSRGTLYLLLGLALMILSVVFAFLMTVGAICSSFGLNFAVYGASFAGVLLGVVGVAYQVRFPRRRR